jgi:hypothetical protein
MATRGQAALWFGPGNSWVPLPSIGAVLMRDRVCIIFLGSLKRVRVSVENENPGKQSQSNVQSHVAVDLSFPLGSPGS